MASLNVNVSAVGILGGVIHQWSILRGAIDVVGTMMGQIDSHTPARPESWILPLRSRPLRAESRDGVRQYSQFAMTRITR